MTGLVRARHALPVLAATAALMIVAPPAAEAARPTAGTAGSIADAARPTAAIAGSDPVRDVAVPVSPRPATYAADGLTYGNTTRVAPGVTYRPFTTTASGGPVQGYLVTADLRRASVGLLHPADVGARATVTAMTNGAHAVAGINGDYFNISETTHAGVAPTGSSVGPEVSSGRDLKAAVPDGQRFGPALTTGSTDEDVIGLGNDRRAHLAALHLTGTVIDGRARLPVRGLNQYAIPVGGVGAFTHAWGAVSRMRAVCGTDTAREAPCATDTAEATVRHGVVKSVGDTIGAGDIARDSTILVGREAGADALRSLKPGDRVRIAYHLAAPEHFQFAVGGTPIRRAGAPVPNLDTTEAAPRTAAGFTAAGRRFYLMVIDGRSTTSAGVTLAELSALLNAAGATDAVNLDGGGSSEMAVRFPGEKSAAVQNVPSDGTERPVANGIGIFTRP